MVSALQSFSAGVLTREVLCVLYMSNCVSSRGNCTHVTKHRDLSHTHTWSLFAYGVP